MGTVLLDGADRLEKHRVKCGQLGNLIPPQLLPPHLRV
jgi:hypothetical protein